ncbi:protein TBATA isoform X2 [Strongylocentrotus purpuratus]|uniref:Protein TBATA n=1 Tax=Strongylocentrotus purpuratus TaxID=7668 RepID=A0A7M7NJ60_STRPU|nr:protein TBATA isoform X2 [Strongylocentrotus purpuratus]
MSIPVYRPSKGDGLVVRHTMGHVPENNARSTHHAVSKLDFAGRRPHTQASARFGQLSQSSFFARHNPQSKRVRHIKGLLDFPICSVHDDGYIANSRLNRRPATTDDINLTRRSWPMSKPQSAPVGNMAPLGRLPVHAINYHPNHINPALQNHKTNALGANTQYGRFPLSFRERADPKFGMIPVTDKWRDELRDITEQAGLGLPNEIKQAQAEQPKRTSVYSADTGRLIPPPSRAMTRGASRQKHHEHDLMYHIAVDGSNESLVLEMLCQILQTDSLTAVQSWLVSAGDREKSLVLDMIRSAMNSEADYFQRNIAEAPPPPRPSTNLPANMNVTNGYGDVDIPSPPPFAGRDVRYQAVAEAAAGLKTPKKAENQEKTIFDAEDHPALRQRSHKPDVFKVEHNSSPRPATKNGMHPAKLPPLSPPKHDGGQQDIQNGVSWKPDEAVV